MATGLVFENNKTQTVRLPAEARFPQGVKRVNVRIVGADRVLSPIEKTWDSFFVSANKASVDFLTDKASQEQAERQSLED